MPVASRNSRPRSPILQNKERTYRLSDLAKLLPSEPCYQTVWEWCMYGRKHPLTKELVTMEYIHRPDGLCSSVEAYWRYVDELNGG